MFLRPSVLIGVGPRAVGLLGCRTNGSSEYRAVGLSGRRNIRRSPPFEVYLAHGSSSAGTKLKTF